MDLIYLNRFDSQFDIVVKPCGTTWATFAAFITSGHNVLPAKTDSALFNAVRYSSLDELAGAGNAIGVTDQGERYVKRRQSNISSVDLLVLDYDGTITIQQAKERFKPYEHVGYTSFSHMADGQTHKFRLIIRLTKPIPAHRPDGASGALSTRRSDWYRLRDALHRLAGPCDPASFNANQIYYLPSVRQDQEKHADSWHNPGQPLDWEELLNQQVNGVSKSTSEPSGLTGRKRSSLVLRSTDVLHTQAGDVRVVDIQGTVQGVWCPFHDDRNGTEFARRLDESDRVFLFCKRCDQSFYMVDERPDTAVDTDAILENLQAQIEAVNNDETMKKKEKKKRLAELRQQVVYHFLPEIEILDRYTDASDRRRVESQLDEIKNAILTPESHFNQILGMEVVGQPCAHIVYMPEGAGKSRLAVDIAKEGRTVVFACKSWAQAFEKYYGFRGAGTPLGLSVRMFLSKEAKTRKLFKVEAVRAQPSNPYDSGRINDEATIQRITEAHPELPKAFVRLTWHFLRQDCLYDDVFRAWHPAEGNANEQTDVECAASQGVGDKGGIPQIPVGVSILVTTFAQLRTLHSRMQFIPKDWVVWFDDPDVSDVLDIVQFDPRKFSHWSEQDVAERTFSINGRRYHGRPADESLGRPYRRHLCVYTTTEQITLRGISRLVTKHKQRVRIHDRMGGIKGGKITILGTERVYAKQDAVIPLLVRRLNKQKHSVRLIADGLSQGLNHSSSKGKNDLADRNLIVEVSAPHPAQTQTICDALGLSFETESRDIARDLMLDQMHQAIGRNSGYRFEGGESVVLVDPNQHKWLVKNTRYLVDAENSVLIDRTAKMSRRDRRTAVAASTLVKDIEFFLNNLDAYFLDGRKVGADIDAVMKEIGHPEKRVAYVKRLLLAIHSLSGCHPGNGPGSPDNPRELAYRRALDRIRGNCQGGEWERALAGFLNEIAP